SRPVAPTRHRQRDEGAPAPVRVTGKGEADDGGNSKTKQGSEKQQHKKILSMGGNSVCRENNWRPALGNQFRLKARPSSEDVIAASGRGAPACLSLTVETDGRAGPSARLASSIKRSTRTRMSAPRLVKRAGRGAGTGSLDFDLTSATAGC